MKKTGSGLKQSVKFEEKNVFVLGETPFRPCAIAHFYSDCTFIEYTIGERCRY